jgi:hypothetical protein
MPWTAMHERAAESIEFIRETMVRSASFTAVPGQGGVAMGAIGVLTAVLASQAATPERWLATWLVAAVSRRRLVSPRRWSKHGVTMLRCGRRQARRFMQGFLPSIVAGAALTLALVRAGHVELLPPTGYCSNGAGILAGATASISVLTWVGALFMALGVAAVATVGQWPDVWLGLGFGGLQIVFGIIITRKHGG